MKAAVGRALAHRQFFSGGTFCNRKYFGGRGINRYERGGVYYRQAREHHLAQGKLRGARAAMDGSGAVFGSVGPSEREGRRSCAGCTRRCKSCTRRLFLPAHDIPCTPHQAQPLTVRHRQSATEGPGADRRPTPPALRRDGSHHEFTTSSAVAGGAVKLRGSAGPPFHSLGRASGGARAGVDCSFAAIISGANSECDCAVVALVPPSHLAPRPSLCSGLLAAMPRRLGRRLERNSAGRCDCCAPECRRHRLSRGMW